MFPITQVNRNNLQHCAFQDWKHAVKHSKLIFLTHTHTHLPASHTHLPASCPWRGTSGSDSTGSGFAVACLSGTPCCLDTCRWGLYARSSWRSLCTPRSCTRRSAFLWKHNPKHQYTHAQTHAHIHESMHTKKASTRKDQIADYNCRWFHLQYCRVNWF